MERIELSELEKQLFTLGQLVKEIGCAFIVTNHGVDMFQISPVIAYEKGLTPAEAFDAIVAMIAELPASKASENQNDIRLGRR